MTMDPLAFLESVAGHTQARYPARTPRLGTVDPAYTTGDPKITFDGESSLSGKTYPYAGYTPQAGDRVVLLPVGNTFLIVGAVGVLDGRGKAASVHTHVESDVTSLASDLAGRSLVGHTHDAADIDGITLHEARYQATNGQSIANTTDTKLQFPTTAYTTSDVSASGTNNTDFQVNRGGLWLLTASTRYLAATSGERHLSLCTGSSVGTLSARIAVQSTFPGSGPGSVAVATVIRLAQFTNIFAGTWQNNGTAVSIETAFGATNHISLTWLRP